MPILFVKVGRGLSFPGGFEKALKDGTARATKIIPLRENVIHPLTKENLGTNTGWGMPFVHYEMIEGDYIEITSLLKGFGSEAKTSLAYIPTSEDVDKGIIKFVLDCCRKALGEPCPPYIIGIGLGGSSDIASMLSKKAFLRLPIGKSNPDPVVRNLEEKIFKAVNAIRNRSHGHGWKDNRPGGEHRDLRNPHGSRADRGHLPMLGGQAGDRQDRFSRTSSIRGGGLKWPSMN